MPTEAETKLAEARTALHALLTGQKKVSVRYEGTTVEYRNFAEDIERLRTYIRELEIETGAKPARKPFGVMW